MVRTLSPPPFLKFRKSGSYAPVKLCIAVGNRIFPLFIPECLKPLLIFDFFELFNVWKTITKLALSKGFYIGIYISINYFYFYSKSPSEPPRANVCLSCSSLQILIPSICYLGIEIDKNKFYTSLFLTVSPYIPLLLVYLCPSYGMSVRKCFI